MCAAAVSERAMTHSFLDLMQPVSGAPLALGWRAGRAVSRAEFQLRVAGWYGLIAPLAGAQLALYLDDSIEFAAALFGAWHAGKTVWLSADTLQSSVSALRAEVDHFIGAFPADCQPLQIPPSAPMPLLFGTLSGEFPGLVVHTSGSTGTARAIPKKLAQLDSEVATLEHLFGECIGSAEIIATVSHQHIYGLLFKVLWPLATGRVLHADTMHFPEQLVERLHDRVLISSPAHLKRLPAHLHWPAGRLIFCSGGVLPADAALTCRTLLGHTPVEVYGSSETGGIAWRQRTGMIDDAWHAMPDVQWRVAEHGLLAVRSPHLPDDDWLILSDQIEALDQATFRLKGRCDRIVKIEEKRISLDALERQLNDSEFVLEAKLIMLDTPGRQFLGAVIVPSDHGRDYLQQHGKLALNRQCRAILQDVTEPVAVPRRWRYLDALPTDAQGKTTHAQLQALFARPDKVTAPAYTLILHEQQHAELEVRWPPELHYFAGHFPNAPVLPGVAQVHWAIQIARQIFSITHPFRAMHSLKFQHVVFPEDVTQLALHYDAGKASLKFAYTSSGRRHSSGRIDFQPGAASD